MLELLGNSTPLCDRVSRRAMLQVGALAPLGLSLPSLLLPQAAAAAHGPGFGKAKRCLLMFMWGGPAHQDLWDMKPNAPSTIRGEFSPRSTNVPGLQISELMPNLAQQMDKVALIRSVTHTDNNHSTGAHWMLTGHKHRLAAENFGASPSDHPHLGSVLNKLLPSQASMPPFVSLPDRIATTAGAIVPGQNGGMLGSKYDPFTIDQHPDLPNFKIDAVALRKGIDPVRVAGRQHLRQLMGEAAAGLDASRRVHAMNEYYQQAADLVNSTKAREAFDLAREPQPLRERYGKGTFGQSLLLARRMLEAGVRLVTVYWHRDMPGVDTTWDTHGQNFKQLKERLVPQIDQPVATLLSDLHDRGLLDDTLIVWSSEFGRTPKINGNAGRDHWGPCNTVWLAGGGVPGGQVYGASDKHAAYPADNPVGPADVTATIFHLLGVDPHGVVHDREQRPHTIAHGRPVDDILRGEAQPNDNDSVQPAEQLVSQPNSAILADAPLAYWPLQERSGKSARDLVGSSATNSSVELPSGRTPAAYLGDVATGDQRVKADVRDWADNYTVEFCFLNSLAVDRLPVTGYMFSREGAAAGADRDRGEHLGIGGTFNPQQSLQGKLIVFNGDDSPRGLLVGKTKLEVDRWYHVALVREGEHVSVYLNGNFAQPELSGSLAKQFTTRTLYAATRSDALFALQGRLRDLAIFNKPLSRERLAAHFAASQVKG
ncbi:hypothetical protein ETAA8_63860 [Anatilimnocola aggregata]|uniref:DUF1501 domain-containing protein n=1 Tax=Anatilimnocola aggregata TaxID=2528021 RepID=A0A517YLZ1_9BACT|nr:DUF1501 domain-containing protein [Anatilimnocola aggregata]QDU31233.1 hypothetical protein ETAA8_63860 [Anatilimnocola aggregata]